MAADDTGAAREVRTHAGAAPGVALPLGVAHDAGWVASSLELDGLDKQIDKLHHEVARGCGVSDRAYWILSAIEEAGGTAPLQELYTRWSYARQTVSSAVSSLVERGLVELAFAEGSRKRKVASLTEAGRAFSARHILPAMLAEERAFRTLTEAERAELLRLLRAYSEAIHVELGRLAGDGGDGDDDAPAGTGDEERGEHAR